MLCHRLLPLLTGVAAAALAAAGDSSTDLFDLIGRNDLPVLEKAVQAKKAGSLEGRDRRGATPLMHAAAFGSVEAMKVLLGAGADANAKNSFDATALMWGSHDRTRVRMLLDSGAGVEARSKLGRTALLMAAAIPGNSATVALLLAAGADPRSADAQGNTALHEASLSGDFATMKLLVEKGADVNAVSKGGDTALQSAAAAGSLAGVRLLLTKGAAANAANTFHGQVRKGNIALEKLTPLMLAAPFGTPEMARTLLDAGANVNATDVRGMTALMLAVASEVQDAELVRLLLARGAEVNVKSGDGETALDWARKFANPAVLGVLEKAGAKAAAALTPLRPAVPAERLDPAKAVEKTVALLQRSTKEFFKESGCVGCHHQSVTARLVAAARARGLATDETADAEQVKVVTTQWATAQERLLQAGFIGGGVDTLGYSLLGLHDARQPRDVVTDTLVFFIAGHQGTDGSWGEGGISRSPLEDGAIGRTARSIRCLQVYGMPGRKAEFDQRIARARAWLLTARPRTTDDHAMRLLGLHWTGAGEARAAARGLLRAQRSDGGWGGNPYLPSDAYSTGLALSAMHEAGALSAGDAAYRRGAQFLLRTQYDDGSWYVRSRAPKFQPYFQSGFPFDHDQWISAAGSAYAAMALALTAGKEAARR